MMLSADDARCDGVSIDGDWREGCEDCMRRTDRTVGVQEWSFDPPKIIVFECEYRIPPDKKVEVPK